MSDDLRRFYAATGGFIAPVSVMEYDAQGRCTATFPHGGLTVLDQFAIAAMSELIREGQLQNSEIAYESYSLAQSMLERKRMIESEAGH